MAEVSFKTPLTDSYASFTLEECSQFSLDDDDTDQQSSSLTKKHREEGEAQPLTDRRPSANQNGTNNYPPSRLNDNRTSSAWTQEVKRNSREVSRLTDEVELDGDSGSDDLDLLPPLPSSTSKTNERKRKLKRLLQCCSPYYVRPKCVIM